MEFSGKAYFAKVNVDENSVAIMPEQSSNPRHETLDSFSWFNCYYADLRAALVCFCMTFDLIFETRPISLVNFCLLRLTLYHLEEYTYSY